MQRRRRRSEHVAVEEEPASKRVRPTAEERALRKVRQDVAQAAEETFINMLMHEVATIFLNRRDFKRWCVMACLTKGMHAELPRLAWPTVARMRPGDQPYETTSAIAAYLMARAALCDDAPADKVVAVATVVSDDPTGMCDQMIRWLARATDATMTPWHDRILECLQLSHNNPLAQLGASLAYSNRTEVLAAWLSRAVDTPWDNQQAALDVIFDHIERTKCLDPPMQALLEKVTRGTRPTVLVTTACFNTIHGTRGISDDTFAIVNKHCFVRVSYTHGLPDATVWIGERIDQFFDDLERLVHYPRIIDVVSDVVRRSSWPRWRDAPAQRFNAWVRRLFEDHEAAVAWFNSMSTLHAHLPRELKQLGIVITPDLVRKTRFAFSDDMWHAFGLKRDGKDRLRLVLNKAGIGRYSDAPLDLLLQEFNALVDDVKRLEASVSHD